ncbi:hypothetical protein HOY82DRAFT_535550 [Tuber indicum]|nr:hypothetical protein HOY82DRAFT_535550 [Tuber indicum]
MYIQVTSHHDLAHQDKRGLSKHDSLLFVAILLSITTLLTIGPKAPNFYKLKIPGMIPLNLLRCLENPFADMSLHRPHYSWEVTRRFNYATGIVKIIAEHVERVNGVNSQDALLFLERAGNAMNEIRELKDRSMGRRLTYSEAYKRMGELIEELREVSVEVATYVGDAGEPGVKVLEIPPEDEEGLVNSGAEGGPSGTSSDDTPASRPSQPLPPPAFYRADGPPVGFGGVARARGLSRSNATARRLRRLFPRTLSEERQRSGYVTTTIVSPKPDRTGLLGAGNPLLDDAGASNQLGSDGPA